MKIKENVDCACQISCGWGRKSSVKTHIEISRVGENGETIFGGGRYLRLDACEDSRWKCPLSSKPRARKRGEDCKYAFSHPHYIGGSWTLRFNKTMQGKRIERKEGAQDETMGTMMGRKKSASEGYWEAETNAQRKWLTTERLLLGKMYLLKQSFKRKHFAYNIECLIEVT